MDWTKEQVLGFVERIRSRDVAFVQDPASIKLIREERKGEEWGFLREHVVDEKLRILVIMGLTLRRLEKARSDLQRLHDLRDQVRRKYGTAGLQAAELVQRGILGIFLARFLRDSRSHADIVSAVEELLERVEEYTEFVQASDSVRETVKELAVRIVARTPRMFIILGYGEAKDKAKKVLDELLKALPKTYDAEINETGKTFSAFVGKVEQGELRLELPV